MEEYEHLFLTYNKMGLQEKRAAIDRELAIISGILEQKLKDISRDDLNELYFTENSMSNNLDESEVMNRYFRNIYNIKNKLSILIALLDRTQYDG